MDIILIGLFLWISVHLIPAVTPQFKNYLLNKLGENNYKLLFTISIAFSIFLIVYGWRHSTTSFLYVLPDMIYTISSILLLFSCVLFASTILPTRLLKFIRHPQLLFVLCWSVAHLLINGDSRSVLLFSGMAIWAILEIIFINKRDGDWIKMEKNPMLSTEIKSIILSLALFAAIIFGHEYLSGIALI